MTSGDVARALGISKQTVYNHLHSGRLGAEWTGTRWNIRPADAYYWAQDIWDEGRCNMRPPSSIEHYCEWFNVS